MSNVMVETDIFYNFKANVAISEDQVCKGKLVEIDRFLREMINYNSIKL